jgi:hypothetical protein
MNHIGNKLKEAKYFLEQMNQAFEDDDIFSYNLSAFWASARSITFYMQKQYAHCAGFHKWYSPQQLKMEADRELNYLNEARIAALKTEPVKKGVSRIIQKDFGYAVEGQNESVKTGDVNQEIKNEESMAQRSPITVRRFLPEFNDASVIEFCEKQLGKLEKLVRECEERFPQGVGIT